MQNGAAPIRVLYVEDDTSLQYTLSKILEIYGYEVACADNGQTGVEKAESWQPDVILMDIRMPVMTGIEATRVLRSRPATQNIPIFILSAYTDAKTRNSCNEVGVNGFFTKPPDIRKIDATIKRVLNITG